MKLSSLRLTKSGDCKVQSRFLFPLTFCFSFVGVCLPPQATQFAVAQTVQAGKAGADRLLQQGLQQHETGQFRAALRDWQQALQIYRAIQDRSGEGIVLGNIGAAYYFLDNYDKAIESVQQMLAIARALQDRQSEGEALSSLGRAFLKAGNPSEAEKMLINSIQVWESMRQKLGSNDANKIAIFERQGDTYRVLQQVRVAQNNPNAALEIAERGRARAFVDLLTQSLSSEDAKPISTAAPNQA